jgi:Zinc carboxypeptidase/Chitobiase/beta-hexosaminidase C-terminal domain
MSGLTLPGNAPQGALAQSQTVVLTSRAWGHEGGNDIRAAFVNPGTPNSPLSVTVIGKDITVNLGTNSTGALSSTAAQVVAAINADPGASALVVALTYRGNAGAGIVQPRVQVNLSDFLNTATNGHVQRGPLQYSVMRIGKHRDGSKVGVFLYCQQHAREWATPLTCLETAEQLLRNYALDSRTRQLVDNLDIFILPSSNPDGAHYSMYNFASQRKNMTNQCVVGGKVTDDPTAATFWTPRTNPSTGAPYTNTDPASRTAWGVDLNRNNTVGTIFDEYIGASHSCTSEVYAGPSEASEPEIKNEHWVADTFTNIKFSNNIHSFGGYFMWAPGTYRPDRSEGEAVHANIGIEKYFFAAGDRILNRIKEHRGTAILPERTGPVADVLYSAAGNSADEHWYRRQVIAYSFETGADRYEAFLSAAAPAGAPGIRISTGSFGYLEPGDTLSVEGEVRTVASIVRPNPPSPNPNILFTAPLSQAHPAGARVEGATLQTGVGFQPDYASEGKHEALEFAAGNYGLLESALAYARDDEPPVVQMKGPYTSRGEIVTTFEFVNEPSVIRYTTDGSTPTASSTLWDSSGPREPGSVFHVTQTTMFRWRAVDIKGNVSTGSQRFNIAGPPNG